MPQQFYTFEPDPEVFLRDFGMEVIAGTVSGLGIYSKPGEMTLEDGAIIEAESVLALHEQFGSLRYNDSLTVGGDRFKVQEPIPQSDGRFVILTLLPDDLQLTRIDYGSITDAVTVTENYRLVTGPNNNHDDWGAV